MRGTATIPSSTKVLCPEEGAWICRRRLSLRAAVNLQPARPRFVLQEKFRHRLATVRQPKIGLLASLRPMGTDDRAHCRDSRLSSCVLCDAVYSFVLRTRRNAVRRFLARQSSGTATSGCFCSRSLGAQAKSSLSWGALGRKDGLQPNTSPSFHPRAPNDKLLRLRCS